jgi:NAD(P)-dependent dehydrogenase (short-subunit alcohol dehydrogenase family)
MAKALIESMRDRNWGRIVNLASNSLGLPVPGLAHYMASKGGVIGLTRALASDLALEDCAIITGQTIVADGGLVRL